MFETELLSIVTCKFRIVCSKTIINEDDLNKAEEKLGLTEFLTLNHESMYYHVLLVPVNDADKKTSLLIEKNNDKRVVTIPLLCRK